jgi:hypothetical protein
VRRHPQWLCSAHAESCSMLCLPCSSVLLRDWPAGVEKCCVPLVANHSAAKLSVQPIAELLRSFFPLPPPRRHPSDPRSWERRCNCIGTMCCCCRRRDQLYTDAEGQPQRITSRLGNIFATVGAHLQAGVREVAGWQITRAERVAYSGQCLRAVWQVPSRGGCAAALTCAPRPHPKRNAHNITHQPPSTHPSSHHAALLPH